ncbi:hypothetical protein AMTR_s00063p00106240 [Amborella trichopoda]|uniref:Uncharacterized protein n=1 Tax=Amborella trichopoda TaxID=13333 RepID=U5D798_AMBTC|nr:hypothetical protein AMTR_s00063p00106240 [Amborella trichopoda]
MDYKQKLREDRYPRGLRAEVTISRREWSREDASSKDSSVAQWLEVTKGGSTVKSCWWYYWWHSESCRWLLAVSGNSRDISVSSVWQQWIYFAVSGSCLAIA